MVVNKKILEILGVVNAKSALTVNEPSNEALFASFIDDVLLSDSKFPYYLCQDSGEWSVESYNAISPEDILLEDLRDQMLHILHAYLLGIPVSSSTETLGKKEGYIRIVNYAAAGKSDNKGLPLVNSLRHHDPFLFKRQIDTIDSRMAQERAALDGAFGLAYDIGGELLDYVGGLVDRLSSIGVKVI